MTANVDVVIPVRNESFKFRLCCESVLKHVPVNNLIIVVPSHNNETLDIARKYGDKVIADQNKGVGHARSLGLKEVETEYYVSLDADTIIPEKWYSTCAETMRKAHVAACQGYDRPIGQNYAKWLQILVGERHCSLGNTMLRTDIVRKVGMPTERWLEDYVLRDRMTSSGYEWITLFDLVVTHWVSDVDVFRHYVRFGSQQKTKLTNILTWLVVSTRAAGKSYFQHHDVSLSAFLLLMRYARCYGAMKALARTDGIYDSLPFW